MYQEDSMNSFNFDLISAIKGSIYQNEYHTKIDYENAGVYLYCDPQKLSKPCKQTILHDYIVTVMSYYYGDYFHEIGSEEIISTIKNVFASLNLTLEEKSFDDIEDTMSYYQEQFENIQLRIAHDVFNILFCDKKFLRDFNLLISQHVKSLNRKDHPDILKKDGVLKRYSPLQGTKWLLNALCYRDKEKCQICGKDLSRSRSPQTGLIHIDHIVPLKLHGSNDPTNMQILCSECNLQKSANESITYSYYSNFWELP